MEKEKISQIDFEIEFRAREKQYEDLMQDFLFVKDLNRVMSIRYQEVMDCFPTVKELDLILENFTANAITFLNYNKSQFEERMMKLRKFRSALVALENNDPQIKPKKFEDYEN